MVWSAEVNQAVAHWSRVYGVPALTPALVHGILERESRHGQDPNYLRHGGVVPEPGGHVSYGPMQIYDDTVRTVLKLGFPGEDLATHPELGIWYGTKYLASLLARFGGNVARAVSGYNAGPGRANRNAAGQFPNQPYVDFVLAQLEQYRSAVTGSLPALALVGVLVWFASRRRRAA